LAWVEISASPRPCWRATLLGTCKGINRLQEIKSPGTNDGLRTALHAKFTTDVVDVPFHRVHTQDKAMGDFPVGGSLKEQSQHIVLALGERVQKRTGASGGKRKIRDDLLTKGGEQGSDVLGYDTAHVGMAQQGLHRYTFVDEKTNVALWFSEHERPFQGGQGTRPVTVCLQGQRTQHKDFQHAAHACFGLSIPEQPIQQAQDILQERTLPVVARLRDAHPRQGQVLTLAGVPQDIDSYDG
jgi:hypothetical protein